ncbi:hypothetical protein ACLOJK_032843 [Asimina triloba]
MKGDTNKHTRQLRIIQAIKHLIVNNLYRANNSPTKLTRKSLPNRIMQLSYFQIYNLEKKSKYQQKLDSECSDQKQASDAVDCFTKQHATSNSSQSHHQSNSRIYDYKAITNQTAEFMTIKPSPIKQQNLTSRSQAFPAETGQTRSDCLRPLFDQITAQIMLRIKAPILLQQHQRFQKQHRVISYAQKQQFCVFCRHQHRSIYQSLTPLGALPVPNNA